MQEDNCESALPLDALVRSIGVNRGTPFVFFLGAGSSISSGVRSAQMCIWEWKRRVFLTNNPGLEDQFSELSLESVRDRIQRWLDKDGKFPELGSSGEYGFYAEYCFPIPQDRRRYFSQLAKEAQPRIGYKLLCLLASAGLVTEVWTTNFDGLIGRTGASSGLTVIEVGLDCTDRAYRQPVQRELLCVAIHGDYRYDPLKNTDKEIKQQDEELRKKLTQNLQDANLIVAGYSGNDASVMESLAEAYSQPGTGRLYWCGYGDSEPSDSVQALLATAKAHNRDAFYSCTSGFDDLLVRIALHCLADDNLDTARKIISAETVQPVKTLPFSISNSAVTDLMLSNAFPVECPSEVLQFRTLESCQPGAWRALRRRTEGTNVIAVPLKGNALAIGTVDDVKAAFGKQIVGDITRSPIGVEELANEKSAVVSLMTQALTRAIAAKRGLQIDGKSLLWTDESSYNKVVNGIRCKVYTAASLHLRRHKDKQYLTILPTIRGTTEDGNELPDDIDQELKRSILTYQYNQQFYEAVNQWRNRIMPKEERKNQTVMFEAPPNCGSTFKFTVSSVSALAGLSVSSGRRSLAVPEPMKKLISLNGLCFEEPKLIFSNTGGDGYVGDRHPMRGIMRNQPYDYALTKQGFSTSIRVGVVCPAADSAKLSRFLNSLYMKKQPDSKEEYLLDYPGFNAAFGLPLEVAQPNDNGWIVSPEPSKSDDVSESAVELARNLISCIRALRASSHPSVVLVYIPKRWFQLERCNVDGVTQDLHDHIKAACVQEGITTQFLKEATLSKQYQCEIIWWLALSFYVKSMRTPWVLESLGPETAFAGLGFSIDQASKIGNHIVLGCSHIYNTGGLGLRYNLSKIENPIIRGDNPFMSRDDSRRVGESIRQLCYESMQRLPDRVVMHKRTPFTKDEQEGLLDGLSGVRTVDMLEITRDPALRYTACHIESGKLSGDAFPIRRGAALVLDDHKALLWVHGTARPEINPRKPSYYQGKSRIPAPLVVTRHYGASDFSTLATEILGLSKMDWNSFDLYTKMPATIKSSNAIARIGTLLERFGSMSYDYRLFI